MYFFFFSFSPTFNEGHLKNTRRGLTKCEIPKMPSSALDTGHFFNTSLIQGLVFQGIVKGQESKVWAFFKGLRSFRGPQKQN